MPRLFTFSLSIQQRYYSRGHAPLPSLCPHISAIYTRPRPSTLSLSRHRHYILEATPLYPLSVQTPALYSRGHAPLPSLCPDTGTIFSRPRPSTLSLSRHQRYNYILEATLLYPLSVQTPALYSRGHAPLPSLCPDTSAIFSRPRPSTLSLSRHQRYILEATPLYYLSVQTPALYSRGHAPLPSLCPDTSAIFWRPRPSTLSLSRHQRCILEATPLYPLSVQIPALYSRC